MQNFQYLIPYFFCLIKLYEVVLLLISRIIVLMGRYKWAIIVVVRVKIRLQLGSSSKDVDGRCFRRSDIGWSDKTAKERVDHRWHWPKSLWCLSQDSKELIGMMYSECINMY